MPVIVLRFCVLLLALVILPASGQQIPVKTELVADGFNAPLYVTSHPENADFLYVVEKGGMIWIVENGTIQPEPLLDISDRVSSGGEQGLLGFAHDPFYNRNHFIYVNYTNADGNTKIKRYRVLRDNPYKLKPGSEKDVLSINQPFANHNGGHLAVGPDSFLYISLGDGGGGGDPQNNAQNTRNPLGAILRIEIGRRLPYTIPVINPFTFRPGNPLIAAYGLRNPWRFSFDRQTGDLWIGDVGQNAVEEINMVPLRQITGTNFGWNELEGTREFAADSNTDTSQFTPPVYEYTHASGKGGSVTGGYVYRGSAIPALTGYYIFGDFISGRIFTFRMNNGSAGEVMELTDQLSPSGQFLLASFGEDSEGELYICDFSSGAVYKIVPR